MFDQEQFITKLMILSEQLWEGRVDRRNIERWLANFIGKTTDVDLERQHALFLLSHVMYFAERELRELLRALFRDHYRYRVVQDIRAKFGGTTDIKRIHSEFNVALAHTRFLALGNPSESGTHLLYWFRQENRLPRELFVHPFELADRSLADPEAKLSDPKIERLVFVDDFCGSGSQAVRMADAMLPLLRRLADSSGVTIDISYLVLFANTEGIARVRERKQFDSVETVFELDDSYRVFSENARQFTTVPDGISKQTARAIAETYGTVLSARWPLGFKDGQLLLAFHHNIPNNSLPILWSGQPEQEGWHGIFRRFPKYYGRKHS
jgi:hypothetical protein